MNNRAPLLIAAFLSTSWLAVAAPKADAQTYDVDIGVGSQTLSGTFTFSPSGTGICSAAFCAQGLTPQFTNINLIGTGGFISQGGFPTAFTGIEGGQEPSGENLAFVETYLGAPGLNNSNVLIFDVATAGQLGSSNVGLTGGAFLPDDGGPATETCGTPGPTTFRIVNCVLNAFTEVSSPSPPAAAAPEIDPSGALSGLTLLAGGLLVLRGKRRRSRTR